jgi:hypothetical protein
MMEKIKDLYYQYFDQVMAWYDGLELMYQYGVFMMLIGIGFIIVIFFIVSRIIK